MKTITAAEAKALKDQGYTLKPATLHQAWDKKRKDVVMIQTAIGKRPVVIIPPSKK